MSIFDHPDTVSAAPSWRCPRCRTLQAQTTRCWRCSQAAYSCESCHLYRPSVAAGIGYCAADPAREPVRADETRSCWDAAPAPTVMPGLLDEPATAPGPALRSSEGSALRGRATKRPQKTRPPLEEPGRAAWAEPGHDRLVDAPLVEPGAKVTQERQRRTRRRWFG